MPPRRDESRRFQTAKTQLGHEVGGPAERPGRQWSGAPVHASYLARRYTCSIFAPVGSTLMVISFNSWRVPSAAVAS